MHIEVEKGVRLFVQDLNPAAESRPVVFVHGWPFNHKMFEYQFNMLPQHGFRCIGLDLRGFGQSDKPWDDYSYDRLADDLSVVLETMQVKDAVLVGFSIGGAISIRYMSRHGGSRIRKLALVAPAAPVFTKRPDYPYGLPVEQINDSIQLLFKDRPQALTDFGRMFFNRDVGQGTSDWLYYLGLEAASHAMIRCLISLREEDLRNDLRQIRVPTAIFHGVHDRIVPFTNAQTVQQGITDSHLYPFYNSGHGLFIEEVENFNTALLGFL